MGITTLGVIGVKHIKNEDLTLKRKGDLAEHYAIVWLWKQGYEVFRNCGSTGKVDMVAVDPSGEVILIDVKTLNYACGSNGKNKMPRTPCQKDAGIVLLGYNPNTNECRWVRHRDGSNSSRSGKPFKRNRSSSQLQLVI